MSVWLIAAALTSTLIFGSDSRGTHDHIILSHDLGVMSAH
jgi:hypothetical protein